ncbi:MAG: MCP four helix bundle domain-containing protein [Deltaproteobacteria bacterium]|nr:MCP four helix bundle domain-containing protein [Deltaproteobacteria bacterium]
MWYRINLRNRIYLILTALVFITLLYGLITVWYTYRLERVLTAIIDRNLVACQSAEAFESSLINQKGFVSYYFLDGDPDWLRQLGKYRQIFNEQLHTAKLLVEDEQQKLALDQIDREYQLYIDDKDRVIAYYKTGEREQGTELHRKVRDRFFNILELCKRYKEFHTQKIMSARNESLLQARKLRFIAGVAMLVVFSLSVLLAFILAKQILDPLHRLAQEANKEGILKKSGDEVKAISRSVHDLIEAAGQTHIELERSREHLLQAEKMAMVGKLAAGMAHSIRNPLTSVKMRLFSLSRSLELSDYQKEDFDVISEEIRHTDAIVQSFLEFSRPPRLKMQQISPSIVVDMGLQLLEHRLKSYDVKVNVIRKHQLPEIQADPEQLKEVLVNLIINACEAMEQGGSIVIEEEEDLVPPSGRVAVIRLKDNGPGIPESIHDNIFQPFFTTKEEGTGLGLSIAARIVEEHQGRLDIQSKEGQGSTFIITLPIKG